MSLFSSKIIRISAGIILTLLLAGALATPSEKVWAATPDQSQTPTQPVNTANLEKRYQQELKALAAQSNRLARVDDFVVKAQDRINKLEQKGLDVSTLRNALNTFNDHLTTAKQEHARAEAILNAHTGFDTNGKVTDASQAKNTLKTAAQHLKSAHQELRPSMRELVKTIRDFIRANRPNK